MLEAERSGREHPQVASSLENLGTTAWFQGDYEEAARRYEEVYEIRRATLGPGNPKTANTVMNLGLIDHVRGDYPAAVDKLERSIEMFTAPVGREHPSTAQALGNLAVTLSEMGQRERSNAFNRESLEIYEGPIWASHNNCRALVPDQRQFSDEQLKAIIERDGVIGAAFDAWMMHPGWVRGVTDPRAAGVNIARIIEQIDHVCQLAGNARHSGIGSDLDGGFGREQCPYDMESIADLQQVAVLLAERGYSDDDVHAIMHGN